MRELLWRNEENIGVVIFLKSQNIVYKWAWETVHPQKKVRRSEGMVSIGS